MTMNRRYLRHMKKKAERLLSMIPEARNIDRASLEAHIKAIEEQLKDLPDDVSETPSETQASIAAWGDSTFGETSIPEMAWLILGEVGELFKALHRGHNIGQELADVSILLHRTAAITGHDLQQEVNEKMRTNRSRDWVVREREHEVWQNRFVVGAEEAPVEKTTKISADELVEENPVKRMLDVMGIGANQLAGCEELLQFYDSLSAPKQEVTTPTSPPVESQDTPVFEDRDWQF
ncbi:MAG: hypothetical protein HQL56_05605 [Magnetococcales bacterium]|nr:hypothetical protein [Magnetococcales bacterium]